MRSKEYVYFDISKYKLDVIHSFSKKRIRHCSDSWLSDSDWTGVFLSVSVPTAAPSALKTFAKSSTEVIVSWLVPAEDTHNGALLGFKVNFNQLFLLPSQN